jgi:hypothetical protein
MNSDYLAIASAFYSKQRLDALHIDAAHLDLLVRLDTSDVSEWVLGSVAPDALLDFVRRVSGRSIRVRLLVSPTAHAKVYLGSNGFLVGSANLTVRGFGGLANEILWYERDRSATRAMRSVLRRYQAGLRPVELDELARFVELHRDKVKEAKAKLWAARKSRGPAEDQLPRQVARPARLGDFADFVSWLDRHRGEAHRLIARRARGEGQLSGHIKRNFFGLRQFFIAHPSDMRHALRQDANSYTLGQDHVMQGALRAFVLREAVDESALSVSTWRTYLPQSAGGKPKSGGGTSGNLKRMIPIVAQYLNTKVG